MQDAASPNRTLDLASALEVGSAGNKAGGGANSGHSGNTKSVMTIAFQFAFEVHLQDSIATMARQYVRSIVASVQRVSLALSPSHFGSQNAFQLPHGIPEAQTLARWICNSYRYVYVHLKPPLLCITAIHNLINDDLTHVSVSLYIPCQHFSFFADSI